MEFAKFLTTSLLDHASDYVSILDGQCNFIYVNYHQANIMGYKDSSDIFGKSYEYFKNVSSSTIEIFFNQDQHLLNNKENKFMRYLSYHTYCDGKWHLLLGNKSCIRDGDKIIGIFSQAQDITNNRLIDFSRFLFESSKKYIGKPRKVGFNYVLSTEHTTYKLSKKELLVLFYFLRGKTAREIANIIVRSEKTINMHIESIKNKFSVASKSALIEKAIFEGFANIIPEEVLSFPSPVKARV